MVLSTRSLIAISLLLAACTLVLLSWDAKADPGAECAKLLGKNQYEYRTCLAVSRGTPGECASIENETDRVRCRARAGASANRR